MAIYSLGLRTKSLEKTSKPNLMFLLGDTVFQKNNVKTFVCFQGIQGNELILRTNIVLPAVSFMEKNALFVNIEGRFQNSQKTISSPKNTRSDFYIIFSLMNMFDNNFHKKLKTNFLLKQNKIPFFKSNTKPFFSFFLASAFLDQTKITNKNIISTYNNNYYQTNLILKNSVVMAKSSKMLLLKSPFI